MSEVKYTPVDAEEWFAEGERVPPQDHTGCESTKECLPRATASSSWWSRIVAWWTAKTIQKFCATCHGKLPNIGPDDGICFWCQQREHLRVRDQNDRESVVRRMLYPPFYPSGHRRPEPTSLPGPAEKVSR